jgi:hypothetical protein
VTSPVGELAAQPDPAAPALQWPTVRITNTKTMARNSKIELDGQDISAWCCRYEVVGALKDLVVLRLDLYVGELEIETPVDPTVVVDQGLADLLVEHGWTPPPAVQFAEDEDRD